MDFWKFWKTGNFIFDISRNPYMLFFCSRNIYLCVFDCSIFLIFSIFPKIQISLVMVSVSLLGSLPLLFLFKKYPCVYIYIYKYTRVCMYECVPRKRTSGFLEVLDKIKYWTLKKWTTITRKIKDGFLDILKHDSIIFPRSVCFCLRFLYLFNIFRNPDFPFRGISVNLYHYSICLTVSIFPEVHILFSAEQLFFRCFF